MSRRIQRPDRETLKRLIREAGNITKLAGLLDVSRPTVYEWLDQTGLSSFAGVYRDSSVDSLYSTAPEVQENTEKAVKTNGPEGRTLHVVASQQAVAFDPRVNTSVRMRTSVWKRMRKRAIDEGRPVADLLEEASVAYLGNDEADEDPTDA